MFNINDQIRVVMLIPHRSFRDDEFLQTRNALTHQGITVVTASTALTPAKGSLGYNVTPNIILNDIHTNDYDGLILVGGDGTTQYWDDSRVHELAWEFRSKNRPLGAIGNAVVILARAGIMENPSVIIRDILQNTLHSTEQQKSDTRGQVRQNLLAFADAKFARTFGEQFAQMLLERENDTAYI